MKVSIFVLLCLFASGVYSSPPTIYVSKGQHGVEFRNFEFALTPQNTILPGDSRIKRHPLDERAEQFQNGQFEIFIPTSALEISTGCSRYYIVRMAQTLDTNMKADIQQKQNLFYAIKSMVKSQSGSIRVVLEYPEGCNIFFRTGRNGTYIDYVGQLH